MVRPMIILSVALLAGCASSHKQPTTRPTDSALKDPMGYSPDMGDDVSGGNINQYDHNGMKRDVDSLLNP